MTTVTKGRMCHFGRIINGRMILSPMGRIVAEQWRYVGQWRPNVQLDAWIVMPNHFHAIVIITCAIRKAEGHPFTVTLGSIMSQFKSGCTKQIWKAGYSHFRWQTRFYDSIVRSESGLHRVRRYIWNNPRKWRD